MPLSLSICIVFSSATLTQAVEHALSHDRYYLAIAHTAEEFYKIVDQEKNQLDCLLLESGEPLLELVKWLHGQAILLPAVIFDGTPEPPSKPAPLVAEKTAEIARPFTYHTAEVQLSGSQVNNIEPLIDRAIAQFIHLSPTCRINHTSLIDPNSDPTLDHAFIPQQRRLTEKLKERLGYLGVYYKRDTQNFFRHLPPTRKQKLLNQLRADYRNIALRYFENDGALNDYIDNFVNTSFFADIAVSQIVEIHMELIDEFSKQLKLEGRSDEILLDYRLTLIDTIAHLCEMYRRSIPRES